MKQETRITPRQANRRYSVTDMVTNPARSAAIYGGAFASGAGICGMAYYLAEMKDATTGGAVLAVIGLFLVGLGGAGSMATKRNFNMFVSYVLDSFVEDRTETIEATPQRPSGTKAIPYTANGVTTDLELSDANPLTESEWQAVANAVLMRRAAISEAGLAREHNALSQPKYKLFYSYMVANGYLQTTNGRNHLTAAGETYLKRWM
jgi:hypothetical protein